MDIHTHIHAKFIYREKMRFFQLSHAMCVLHFGNKEKTADLNKGGSIPPLAPFSRVPHIFFPLPSKKNIFECRLICA